MKDEKTIQSYVNNFRRHMGKYLKKGLGIACRAYPSKEGGGIIEFKIGPNLSNDDEIMGSHQSVNEILKIVPQKIIGGNIAGVKFSGTNISMEPDRILLIKGEDDTELWNDKGALSDVTKIIDIVTKGQKK